MAGALEVRVSAGPSYQGAWAMFSVMSCKRTILAKRLSVGLSLFSARICRQFSKYGVQRGGSSLWKYKDILAQVSLSSRIQRDNHTSNLAKSKQLQLSAHP